MITTWRSVDVKYGNNPAEKVRTSGCSPSKISGLRIVGVISWYVSYLFYFLNDFCNVVSHLTSFKICFSSFVSGIHHFISEPAYLLEFAVSEERQKEVLSNWKSVWQIQRFIYINCFSPFLRWKVMVDVRQSQLLKSRWKEFQFDFK